MYCDPLLHQVDGTERDVVKALPVVPMVDAEKPGGLSRDVVGAAQRHLGKRQVVFRFFI